MMRDGEPDRAELETLWMHVPTGVILVDAASGRTLRMNPAAERLLHTAASGEITVHESYRAYGRDGRRIRPEEWPLARTLAKGETVRGELVEFERPDRSRRTLAITSVPIYENGRLTAGLGLFDDVTDRERDHRVAREFVTNAAHELQTPLAAITSAIEVLQAGAKEQPEERDRFLRHIEQAAARLGRLSSALLILSRTQARLEEPRAELIELHPFLSAIADEVQQTIEVHCEPRIAAVANRTLLEQAVTNLLDNALKHSGEGVVVSGELADGAAKVVVRDSGPGIPAAEQGQVFERFYRREDGSGFGLGLAIVREIVDALGGGLALDSDQGGTSVSIVLPGARVRSK